MLLMSKEINDLLDTTKFLSAHVLKMYPPILQLFSATVNGEEMGVRAYANSLQDVGQ